MRSSALKEPRRAALPAGPPRAPCRAPHRAPPLAGRVVVAEPHCGQSPPPLPGAAQVSADPRWPPWSRFLAQVHRGAPEGGAAEGGGGLGDRTLWELDVREPAPSAGAGGSSRAPGALGL